MADATLPAVTTLLHLDAPTPDIISEPVAPLPVSPAATTPDGHP
jgi:hypothetical protein